MIMINYAYM
jgi:hypothetical protein